MLAKYNYFSRSIRAQIVLQRIDSGLLTSRTSDF